MEDAVSSGNTADIEDELGDLLFAVVNLIRFRNGSSSEELMRRANHKFERRFREVEKLANTSGKKIDTLSADELNALWNKVKSLEK